MNDLKGIIEDCNKSDLVSDKIIKKIIEIIGQEEWQDLHDENNDICTTMGELIITLKGIAEIEKENAELKADNDARKFAMVMSEKVEKQLREENAELKGLKDVATLIRANNDTVVTLMQLNNKLVSKSQQLTKAKEIIKTFLAIVNNDVEYVKNPKGCKDLWKELCEKAEQFIKDSEVEK